MNATRWDLAGVGMVWAAVAGLVVISRGDVERRLTGIFAGRAMPDAFKNVDNVLPLLCAGLTGVLVLGVLAAWRRREDVAAVVLMGPGFSFGICLVFENWRDPNWHNILAILFFGCLVGMAVGAGYWVVKRRKTEEAETRLA